MWRWPSIDPALGECLVFQWRSRRTPSSPVHLPRKKSTGQHRTVCVSTWRNRRTLSKGVIIIGPTSVYCWPALNQHWPNDVMSCVLWVMQSCSLLDVPAVIRRLLWLCYPLQRDVFPYRPKSPLRYDLRPPVPIILGTPLYFLRGQVDYSSSSQKKIANIASSMLF